MNVIQHTVWREKHIHEWLRHCTREWQLPFHDNLSHDDFVRLIPPMAPVTLQQINENYIQTSRPQGCIFFTTSGTQGKARMLINRFWRSGTGKGYAAHLKSVVASHLISSENTVANLFTAGGFATLYDGINRLLEALGVNIVPIGRLDAQGEQLADILRWMAKLSVNTLTGTPASIVQCAQLCQTYALKLEIKKILFTGEAFHPHKMAYIQTIWPEVRFYGLYGHAETGFIGVNTPACLRNHYHLFDDWYFLEILEDEQMLVTSWANSAMPIVRYRVGDSVRLVEENCACGLSLPLLHLRGRTDEKFNLAGNLVSAAFFQTIVDAYFGVKTPIQLLLEKDVRGRDEIFITVDTDESILRQHQSALLKALLGEATIRECIEKGAGIIRFLPQRNFKMTLRQKTPLLIDRRDE